MDSLKNSCAGGPVQATRHPQMGMLRRMINLRDRRSAMLAVTLAIPLLLAMALLPAQAQSSTDARPMKIVAFGDSLTAGFGLPGGSGFTDVLQMALRQRGKAVEIVNAGVSGDTTAAGLARLDWAIDDSVDGVIVELGANDALRGQPPEQARANLDTILTRLKARNLPVLLAGMRAPDNWGEDYRRRFDEIFPDLAAKHGVRLYPFFLDGVALDAKLNLGDGLHPNARGIAVIVERILPSVGRLVADIEARRAAAGTAAVR